MAKKIKFGLEMADGYPVRRDLEELRDHFDPVKAIEHFASGKLSEWLSDRYYDDIAEQLDELDKDAPGFQRQLCKVLGVEVSVFDDEELDVERIARTKEKETRLRQKTSDETIIANAAITAFDRGDLVEMWDDGAETIYLCGDAFDIPASVGDTKYIGVLGTPKVTIKAKSPEDLADKGIVFEHVELPEHLWEKKAEGTKVCPKCGMDNSSSAKFCNGCGASLSQEKTCPMCGKKAQGAMKFCQSCGTELDEAGENVAPKVAAKSPAKKEWKIPKSQLKTMFVATFKKDFDYFRGHERFNPNGIDDNATFFMVGPNSNVTHNLTDNQKNIALALICGGQYTEEDLIHLRIKDDMSQGWAFTLDSFCFVDRKGVAGIIPYQSINIPYKYTLMLNDGHEVRRYDLFTNLYTEGPLFKVLANMKNMFQSRA